MIVDTHVHIASADTARYPLRPLRAGGSEWWRDPVGVDDLLAVMDAHDVDRAVLVHALGAYSYDCSYTVEAAAVDPERLRVVVAVDMAGPDPASALASLAMQPGVCGVRLLAMGPADTGWQKESNAREVWRTAGDAGLSVVLVAREARLADFEWLIRSDARVVTVIDHCGMPQLDGGRLPAASPLLALADLPNVWVKLSTPVLVPASRQASPSLLVSQLVEAFGAGRLVWGSDFPQTQELDYAGKLALVAEATAALPGPEREALLGANASALWFSAARGG